MESRRNQYFTGDFVMGTDSEQDLISDLMRESTEINGIDVRYIPRKIGQMDDILLEDRFSEFVARYPTVMYLDSFSGFEGEGDFFSKFGFEARDELMLTFHKDHWDEVISQVQDDPDFTLIDDERPLEGDLVYIPMTKGFFEITYTNNKDPFFQLGDYYAFNLKLQRFTFSYENLDVDVDHAYDAPESGDDPFAENKELDDADDTLVDFDDNNILAGGGG